MNMQPAYYGDQNSGMGMNMGMQNQYQNNNQYPPQYPPTYPNTNMYGDAGYTNVTPPQQTIIVQGDGNDVSPVVVDG